MTDRQEIELRTKIKELESAFNSYGLSPKNLLGVEPTTDIDIRYLIEDLHDITSDILGYEEENSTTT